MESIRQIYSETHRGIRLEVVRNRFPGMISFIWHYYIYINEKQVPGDLRQHFDLPPRHDARYDYMKGRLSELPWHGGITYYGKEGGLDGAPMWFKAGCDYAHYLDQGKDITVFEVLNDAHQTVAALWEMFPDLRVCCSVNGTYHRVEEGEWVDGKFVRSDNGTQNLIES
jgi:hypothetical protein